VERGKVDTMKSETSSTGHNCSSCGQWVAGGTFHFCSVVIPAQTSGYAYVIPNDNSELLERIAKALETIAEHLSKMH